MIGSRWVTTDQVVKTTPGDVYSVTLTAGAGGAATVTIRDGHNTGADAVLVVGSVASQTTQVLFMVPIPTTKGIYVDVGSNVTGVLIQYR